MASWTVNWDSGRVMLVFGEGDRKVELKPLSANCKTLMEFIGGYAFLCQRDPSKNQQLDERFFHKLTGVND
ncbi:Fermitin 2 [Cichlidogyrus casuarinus]|uniref:Fermitin 2 n=1 Tax=Cichlidogyrus casuarinus TaxID=1844966 RepID=A0ABD2Q8D1_9PLAT